MERRSGAFGYWSGVILSSCALALSLPTTASAVILYSTPNRNTEFPGSLSNRDSALGPQGAGDPRRLLNSGWQYEGSFLGFLGTPIAPQFFVSARHIGGSVGSTIDYAGETYETTAYWDHLSDPNNPNSALSDLRIWKVSGAFSSYAPMYNATTDGSEVGKPLVVIGRGTQRGNPVMVGGQLKGWEWGASDGVESWGENVVTGLTDYATNNDKKLMYFDFDKDAGPNEAAMAVGDSSGGVFINSGGVWKLAGINYAVDGPWRFTQNGSDFNASLFDAGGLYAQIGTVGNWQLVPNGSIGSSYATRIGAELSWINSIISSNSVALVPEPSSVGIALALFGWTASRRRRSV